MSDMVNVDHQVIHQPWCDAGRHADPATDCASRPVDTHGISSHLAMTDDGPRAYAGPCALTASACFDLAARFADLGQHLLRH